MIEDEINIGMFLEVLDEHDDLRLIGKVIDLDNDMIVIADPKGRSVPPVHYDSEIKFRGFASGVKRICGSGRICGATAGYWRLNRLSFQQYEDLRDNYRQRLNADVTVMLANDIFSPGRTRKDEQSGKFPCRILDISIGGVRVASYERFEVGDYILACGVELTPGTIPPVFSFTCCILRREESVSGYHYGCELVGLTPGEQEELTRAIFEAQRAELRKKRGR